MITQTQGTAKNGLTVFKSGNAYGNAQSVTTSSTDLSHAHSVNVNAIGHAGSVYGYACWMEGPSSYEGFVVGSTSTASLNHSHTVSFTPSVSDNISVSLGDGDSETKPINYTMKIWKRTV